MLGGCFTRAASETMSLPPRFMSVFGSQCSKIVSNFWISVSQATNVSVCGPEGSFGQSGSCNHLNWLVLPFRLVKVVA
jgi:hypothetical protein